MLYALMRRLHLKFVLVKITKSAWVIQLIKVDLSLDIIPMWIDEKSKDQLPHLLKILTI